jgi:hypothetical protein
VTKLEDATKISPKRGNRYDHLKQVLYKKKKALGADAKASKFEEYFRIEATLVLNCFVKKVTDCNCKICNYKYDDVF